MPALRHPSPRRRSGFTLVEVLIASAMGVVIIGTAFAAFRVASQTVTIANRLSLENAMMRAGFSKAQEELDFWQAYDDPGTTQGENLRAALAPVPQQGAHGLIFAPMITLMPSPTFSTDAAEGAQGWDDHAWLPSDSRTWYRGNMAEKCDSALLFGRYAIFSSADSGATSFYSDAGSPAVGTPVGDPPVVPPAVAPISDYSGVTVPHHWHDRQLSAFLRNTSRYMLSEYLPANTIYCYAESYSGGKTDKGGIPLPTIQPGDVNAFCNQDGNQKNARGRYRQTYRTSWTVPPNDPQVQPGGPADPTIFTERWKSQRRYFETGYASTPESLDDFVHLTTITSPVLDVAPANWPRVAVSVNRFIKNARSIALFRLRLSNPETGSVYELSFTGFGTTLRGARQQRYFDPSDPSPANDPGRRRGWANWDDPIPGQTPAPIPDPTLDTSTP